MATANRFTHEHGLVRRQGPVEQQLSHRSEPADAIDYYSLCGPELDQVINGYRYLTGPAPAFSKWMWESSPRRNAKNGRGA